MFYSKTLCDCSFILLLHGTKMSNQIIETNLIFSIDKISQYKIVLPSKLHINIFHI